MKPVRILVVDDDALIGELLAEVLVGMGYEICAIEATEAGAVAAALRCRPDLMLVDVRLGDGSGVAAVEEIQRTRPIPHVFMTADTPTVQALKTVAVVLQKPFREADLSRAVNRALGPPVVL